MSRSVAFEDWVDRARRADCWDTLNHLAPGHAVKLRGRQAVGPCPACGGTDRFSVDRRKNVFYCRKADVGGDAIALARYLTGADFMGAVEAVTGEPPPQGASGQKQDDALLAARAIERRKEQQRRESESLDFRTREISRAREIWLEGDPLDGESFADRYMALRKCDVPPGARLRCHRDLSFWHWSAKSKSFVRLFRGPAMLARIDDAQHRFQGVHCTWIDLAEPKGKRVIIDPETGEILPAKKMRGSKRGGHLHLGGAAGAASHLIIGEGIETVTAVRSALQGAGRALDDMLFWSSCDLGNLGGPSLSSVRHPTLKLKDSKGRERAVKVPGPDPAWPEGETILMPPDQVTRVTILGDGDSDHFSTEQHVKRAAARWANDNRRVHVAWAATGADFNDMWRGTQ